MQAIFIMSLFIVSMSIQLEQSRAVNQLDTFQVRVVSFWLSNIMFAHMYCCQVDSFISFAGDPIYDLIPIYLDIFRGDRSLLEQFLKSYKLPLVRGVSQNESVKGGDKFGRLSYHAM